jgi:hypothetical protein
MAQKADTFDSYDAIGNREDLIDFIWDISPTETPFISAAAKTKATSTKHEWQTDALANASAANAAIEGDEFAPQASAATVRLDNRTQIFTKVASVTGTQRAMNPAGRADELAYQMEKRAKEIKRDMESACLANQAKVAGDATTARRMGGIETWLVTNKNEASNSTAATGAGATARGEGTSRAFIEDQLKAVIRGCWDNGGEPDTIMVPGAIKQVLSGFSGNSTRQIDNSGKKLVTAIDVYVSDFGDLKVVPNRFMNSKTALVLDMSMFAVAELRPVQKVNLAKTHDSDEVGLVGEATLVVRNEKSSGAVFDLSA